MIGDEHVNFTLVSLALTFIIPMSHHALPQIYFTILNALEIQQHMERIEDKTQYFAHVTQTALQHPL